MITIKTVTRCPTCGAECRVEGTDEHRYIPVEQKIAWNKGYKAGLKSDNVDMRAALDRIAKLEAENKRLNKTLRSQSAEIIELTHACTMVEEWWLREGMDLPGYGAPACIFAVRKALEKET